MVEVGQLYRRPNSDLLPRKCLMLLEKSGTLAAHPLSTLHWPIWVRTPDGKIRVRVSMTRKRSPSSLRILSSVLIAEGGSCRIEACALLGLGLKF